MTANTLFLTGADEYFNHQTALPHQVVASSDPNWRERYWVSVHDVVSRDYVLSFGFGKYPNRDVMEGFAIAARGGVQHNVRLSRQLNPAYSDIAVGGLSAEIIDPLRELRFRMADNPGGISFDLTWHASVPPALEGRHFEVSRARVSHDITRYVQTGRISGVLEFGGQRLKLSPDRAWAVRDHSWGIRPMTPGPGDPPLVSPRWNFMAFCPIQFPNFSLHIYLFESQPRRPTHLSAAIMRPEGAEAHDDEIRAVTHQFDWDEDAPINTIRGGSIQIQFYSGQVMEIEIAACAGRAFLSGGGYVTAHGKWRGESFAEHDVYDLTEVSRLRDYNSATSDHLIEARWQGQTGFGIIEYLKRRGYGDARGAAGD